MPKPSPQSTIGGMSSPFPVQLEVNAEDADNPHLSLRDDEGHVGAGQVLLDLSRPLSEELDWLQFLWNYRLGQANEADAVAFGDDLARALFGEGSLASAWAAIGGAAGERPLRLTLALGAGTERFSSLPLELLRDAQGFLFGRAGASLARTLLEVQSETAQLPRRPRVLMAWACPPGTGKFDASPHVNALSTLFEDRLVVLNDATFDGITRALREAHLRGQPFDALHMLAHGAMDMGIGGICLNRPTGGLHRVSAEPFAAGLRGMGLSLAFFCTCQSATSGPGSSFLGLGQQALAESGGDLPCVVAAQANLPVAGSVSLAATFYRLLGEGVEPPQALSEARRGAFADGGAAWSAPVLFVRPAPAAPTALVGVDTAPLPVQKVTWQDRPELIREGREEIEAGRLVSVVGLPGMGKSELGIELARLAKGDGLVDRVLYLPVQRGYSAAAMRTRVAAALGMAAVPGDDRQLAGALASLPQRMLLLLDDAEGMLRDRETARATRVMLDALLDLAPRVRVLLTTRWQVGNTRESERPVRVSSLDPKAEAALLEAELQALGVWKDSYKDEAEWPRLLEMLDGHPRSTVLIARHFTLPGASVRQIVKRLDNLRAAAVVEPDLLGQPDGSLDDGERARLESLVASMDLSFEVLREQSPGAVVAFAALSLFAAGLPEDVANAVAGEDGLGLVQLLRLNLIEWRDGRTRYPLPVRWYAERVRKSVSLDETRVRREAIAAFAELSFGWYQKVLAGQTVSIVAPVLAEEQNLLELCAWAVEHGDTEGSVSQLARVARHVDSALGLASRTETRATLLKGGLACARKVGDRLGEANMLRYLGDVELLNDRLTEARELLQQGLAIARELGDAYCTAGCLRALGDTLSRLDDEDGAQKALQEAIPIYRSTDSLLGEANAQRSLGELCGRLNDKKSAIAALDRALELFQTLNDPVGLANVLITRADTLTLGGDLNSARQDAEQALGLYRAARGRIGEANAMRVLSELHDRAGDLTRADEMLRRALLISREVRDRLGEANILRALGALRMRQDEWQEAHEALSRAMTLFAEVHASVSEGSCCVSMAELLLLNGRNDEVEALLDRAITLYRESRSLVGEANALSVRGELRMRQAELDGAATALREALNLYERIGEPMGSATCLRRLADVARFRGDYAGAEASLARAAVFAERGGLGLELATITCKRAELALMRGEPEAAIAGYQQAMEMYTAQHSQLGVANARLGLAETRRVTGDRAAATQTAQSALALYQEIGDHLGAANTAVLLGTLSLEEGAFVPAFSRFAEARTAYVTLADALGEARTYEGMARCALAMGAAVQSVVLTDMALTIARAHEDRAMEVNMLYLQFQSLQAAQDPPGVVAVGVLMRDRAAEFGDDANVTWWMNWLNAAKTMVPPELFAAASADAEGLRASRIPEARALLGERDPTLPPEATPG